MFVGKTIVITGAAAGIGRCLALKFAAAKADVWAADIDEAGLAALAEEAAKVGQRIECRTVDVRSLEAMTSLRDAVVAKQRQLDVWINNAGIAGLGDFMELGGAAFEKVIDINLRAVVTGTRLALEVMEEKGTGTIVNMASVAGYTAAPYMAAYCASKHAVVGFTRALRVELKVKSSPVRLMEVSPGFVDTAIIAKGEKLGFPEWMSFLLSKPDDVAATIIKGLKRNSETLFPTFNGKVLRRLYGTFPGAAAGSSKLLFTKSLKDILSPRAPR